MLVPIIRTLIIRLVIKIKAVEKEKDLGVIIDKGFTFTEHIAAVVKCKCICMRIDMYICT